MRKLLRVIPLGLGFALFTNVLLAKAPIKISDIKGPDVKGINFGVVVNNSDYQIYRSSELGNDGYRTMVKFLAENKLPHPKTVVYMNHYGYSFPFYFAMQEYELAQKGLFNFHHSFGPTRTYVDGHNPYEPTVDIDERNRLGRNAKKLFPLLDDGIDGGVESFVKVLKMVLDPKNQPVLFHCFGGKHRTGMTALALRYMQGGFWVDGPQVEVKGEERNAAKYEYSLFNKSMFREENMQFIDEFSNDDRFLELQEKFGAKLRE